MNNYEPAIYGFVFFIVFIILNVMFDIHFNTINKLYYQRFFNPDFILNHIDFDQSKICSLLKIKPFLFKFYLKGYFLLNKEQILSLATFLEVDPNCIYKFNIFDSD